jgi:retron-type reverse transcriptase
MKTNNSKEKVRQLQNKLYLTAKKCSSRRFHALYDKVYRDDVLYEAWKRVKANHGSSGVDGITIEDVEAKGVSRYLAGIKAELIEGTYRPLPVRRVMIPKPDGSQRPLGIPTVSSYYTPPNDVLYKWRTQQDENYLEYCFLISSRFD